MAKNDGTASGRTVLVTRFSALGDVAIAVPVLYPVCLANPGVQFVMLTRKGAAAGVMVNRPANLTVVAADVKGEYRGLRGMWRLASRLRKDYGITDVADLHSVMRSWTIDAHMLLHGVTVRRIDKGRRQKRALTHGRLHSQLATSHQRYREVLSRLGLTLGADDFTSLSQYGPIAPGQLVRQEKRQGERWIAIAPFSQHSGKVYPIKMMTTVIDTLASLPGVHLFLMGGGQTEAMQLRSIVERHPQNTVSIADVKHSFADEYGLLCRCDVMLTMDSANMHLASLVGLPAVTVWGATHPWCGFMGWGQNTDNAVQLDLPCRPCSVFGQKPCRFGDYHCLTGINPQNVVQHVIKVMERKNTDNK